MQIVNLEKKAAVKKIFYRQLWIFKHEPNIRWLDTIVHFSKSDKSNVVVGESPYSKEKDSLPDLLRNKVT